MDFLYFSACGAYAHPCVSVCVNQAAFVNPVDDLLPPQDCVYICVAIIQHGGSGPGV